MSKIKFTREDMQKTFMHVDVEMSEPEFEDTGVAMDFGAFANVRVKFNGTLIWQGTVSKFYHSSSRWDNEPEHKLFLDAKIDFNECEFDPEVDLLVHSLIQRKAEEVQDRLDHCFHGGRSLVADDHRQWVRESQE